MNEKEKKEEKLNEWKGMKKIKWMRRKINERKFQTNEKEKEGK